MIDFMETLLTAWGQEAVRPDTEASIRSPLGQVDEGGAGVGGFRCLSTVEVYVAMSRASLAVHQALADLAAEDSRGRTLYQLAIVRYAQLHKLPVTGQRWRLGVSAKAYRCRLDALHVEVAARLPMIVKHMERELAGQGASKARAAWLAKVRKLAKRSAA